jgi:hypothetical protein
MEIKLPLYQQKMCPESYMTGIMALERLTPLYGGFDILPGHEKRHQKIALLISYFPLG